VSRYELVRARDAAALVEKTAAFVVDEARAAIRVRGRFRVALAGGSTPRALYLRLSAPDHAPYIEWPRVEVFFGDERSVPPEHADSNYRMAKESLLERVPLEPTHVHRMEGELPPEDAAARYEAVVGREPLDLVLLGIGEDGHTASLFPGKPTLEERERWVVPVFESPKPPARRVTLTLPAIGAARAVAFLVSGAGKKEAVAKALRQLAGDVPTLPSAMVRPTSGRLYWFVDESAAP
jgi:6-phosphogluconolactonase